MQKQILGYKCKKCGHVHYPYRSRCRKCLHTEWDGADIVWDIVPLGDRGTLLTYTDLYALPPEFAVVKLTLGIVELEGGQRLTGQLHIDRPRTGMKVRARVELVRQSEYDQHYGVVFYEDAEAMAVPPAPPARTAAG